MGVFLGFKEWDLSSVNIIQALSLLSVIVTTALAYRALSLKKFILCEWAKAYAALLVVLGLHQCQYWTLFGIDDKSLVSLSITIKLLVLVSMPVLLLFACKSFMRDVAKRRKAARKREYDYE